MDLKTTLFKFINGNQALARSSIIRVYHSLIYHRLDQSKIVLTILFGPTWSTSCFYEVKRTTNYSGKQHHPFWERVRNKQKYQSSYI